MSWIGGAALPLCDNANGTPNVAAPIATPATASAKPRRCVPGRVSQRAGQRDHAGRETDPRAPADQRERVAQVDELHPIRRAGADDHEHRDERRHQSDDDDERDSPAGAWTSRHLPVNGAMLRESISSVSLANRYR